MIIKHLSYSILGVTEGYKGLQGVRRGYKGFQGVTRGYRGVTRG